MASDAIPALQDCFQCTDWQIFREAAVDEEEVDLEDNTSPVLSYIKCTEDVTKTRTVADYPNQKPWLNVEARSLLKARDAAFWSGDRGSLRAVRRELNAGGKRAKAAYTKRIQGPFTSNDPRSMWRGINASQTLSPEMRNAQGTPLRSTHSTTSTSLRTPPPDSPFHRVKSPTV